MNAQLPPYVIDTNIFIEAKNRYYGFDFCPGFWDALLQLQANGRLISIDRVLQEMTALGDDLSNWVSTVMPPACFADTTGPAILASYAQVMTWVNGQNFVAGAINTFAAGADGWLVAYARTCNGIVVTHEASRPHATSRVPIPNVCDAFNVPYVNTFNMLRALGTQLII